MLHGGFAIGMRGSPIAYNGSGSSAQHRARAGLLCSCPCYRSRLRNRMNSMDKPLAVRSEAYRDQNIRSEWKLDQRKIISDSATVEIIRGSTLAGP